MSNFFSASIRNNEICDFCILHRFLLFSLLSFSISSQDPDKGQKEILSDLFAPIINGVFHGENRFYHFYFLHFYIFFFSLN
jgi:hypothetical membrane protein